MNRSESTVWSWIAGMFQLPLLPKSISCDGRLNCFSNGWNSTWKRQNGLIISQKLYGINLCYFNSPCLLWMDKILANTSKTTWQFLKTMRHYWFNTWEEFMGVLGRQSKTVCKSAISCSCRFMPSQRSEYMHPGKLGSEYHPFSISLEMTRASFASFFVGELSIFSPHKFFILRMPL